MYLYKIVESDYYDEYLLANDTLYFQEELKQIVFDIREKYTNWICVIPFEDIGDYNKWCKQHGVQPGRLSTFDTINKEGNCPRCGKKLQRGFLVVEEVVDYLISDYGFVKVVPHETIYI